MGECSCQDKIVLTLRIELNNLQISRYQIVFYFAYPMHTGAGIITLPDRIEKFVY